MPKIVTLVEGEGDMDAIPSLLYKILHEKNQWWHWHVARPKIVRGLGALKKRLDRVLEYSAREVEGGGILILLDLDDGCPKTEASNLALRVRSLALTCPVAIIFAHREYEAWFLASMNTIAVETDFLPPNLTCNENVETIRSAKDWITRHMPKGQAYKETIHQKIFTKLMDLDLVYQNSRSFQRLYHAIEELVQLSSRDQRGQVTP